MRRWHRLLPLLITALWLPLQAVAGIAMPFCRHVAGQAAVEQTVAAGQHCLGHHDMVDETPASQADQDCDGCELCHLASAGYMPPAITFAADLLPAHDFAARPVLASPSHIPEPPQHPPRRLS